MKINVQKLRGMKFPVENVGPYGSCIVVPGDKFDPDWEDMLEAQGYPVVFTDIGGKKVTLVRLMGREHLSERLGTVKQEAIGVMTPTASTESRPTVSTVRPPKRIPKWLADNPERLWSDEDDKKLVKLWNCEKPKMSVFVMAKDFPKRSVASVYGRLSRLQEAGVIKPRRGRRHPKPPERKPTRVEEKPAASPAPGPAIAVSIQEVSTVVVSPSHAVLTVVLELKAA
jgi:hypothetical protein